MVDVQTVSIAIASAGVFAAAIYYILQIRRQIRARQTDLLIRLFIAYSNKEFVEAYRTVMKPEFKTYEDYFTQCPTEALQMGRFFEDLGVLLRRRLVDIDLISDLFTVDELWEKLQPATEELRRQRNNPSFLEWFEYLYNEKKKREQKLRSKTHFPSTISETP